MRLPALLIAAAIAAPAAAQAVDESTIVNRAKLSAAIEANFTRIDSDSNGTVTKAEIVAAQETMLEKASAEVEQKYASEFRKLDTNQDGMLNIGEFTAAAPEAKARASADARVDKFDADKDGKVTLDEFRMPVLANFDRMDANKDGTLSDDERKKALAQRR